MNIEAVDRRHELRQCVQPRLDFAPIVTGCPIMREILHRRERDALGVIDNRFPVRASGLRRCAGACPGAGLAGH